MTNFFLKYRLLLQQPLPVLWKKGKHKLLQSLRDRKTQKDDLSIDKRATLSTSKSTCFTTLFPLSGIDTSSLSRESLKFITDQNSKGNFSLLGSGWINNTIGSPSFGIEGICYPNELKEVTFDPDGNWLKQMVLPAHLDYSKLLWKNILSKNRNYTPIDWQKDFKSGYRFSAKRWHKHQRSFAKQHPGVDIKVPWELGRLQHFPQLALEARLSPDKAKELILTYRSQLLDFIATNPYNMGVNWSCPMDVGIRVANILLSLEWFLFLDKEYQLLDSFFQEQALRFALLHGRHIVENFEYREGLTSNHYLGNIAGLTFLSSYLSGPDYIDEWLALCMQEWSIEIDRQFLSDGSNFEGSTAYHRLSGEFVTFCASALQRIPEDRKHRIKSICHVKYRGPIYKKGKGTFSLESPYVFSSSFYLRINHMRIFTKAYTKPCGNIVQIGDNDSGRFFKLSPVGEMMSSKAAKQKYQNLSEWQETEKEYFDENDLDHSPFIGAIEGLLNLPSTSSHRLEYTMLQSPYESTELFPDATKSENTPSVSGDQPLPNLKYNRESSWDLPSLGEDEELQVHCFMEFGLIVFRTSQYFVSLRITSREKTMRFNGHKHNDLLSIELQIQGENKALDPGSYLYTPFPETRNQFRKTDAHAVLLVEGKEQNTLPLDASKLFFIGEEASTEVLLLTNHSVIASLQSEHYLQRREISIEAGKLFVRDQSTEPFTSPFKTYPFSNGYGKQITKEYA